jgi:hypothetical protein
MNPTDSEAFAKDYAKLLTRGLFDPKDPLYRHALKQIETSVLGYRQQLIDYLSRKTGVKDKHGKEILEGDIVKLDYAGTIWICLVCWSELHVWFFLAPAGDKRVDGNTHFNFYSERPQYYEVLGNINDNPGLLPKDMFER